MWLGLQGDLSTCWFYRTKWKKIGWPATLGDQVLSRCAGFMGTLTSECDPDLPEWSFMAQWVLQALENESSDFLCPQGEQQTLDLWTKQRWKETKGSLLKRSYFISKMSVRKDKFEVYSLLWIYHEPQEQVLKLKKFKAWSKIRWVILF